VPDHERVFIKRGNLTGTAGAQAAPGNGATITIFDSTTVDPMWCPLGLPFERIEFNVYSSHDSGASGVVFSSSFDRGSNFRTQSTNTYSNASGATTYDYLVKGGHVKIAYTNSANVLTAWEYELWGVYDRNPGS
jgi:hypothetical protein